MHRPSCTSPWKKATKRELGSEGIVTDPHTVKDGSYFKEVPAAAGEADTSTDLRIEGLPQTRAVGCPSRRTRTFASPCKGPSCRSHLPGMHAFLAGTQRAQGVLEPAVLEGQKKGGCHRRDFTFGRAGFGRVGNVRQSRSFLFHSMHSRHGPAAGASLAPNSKSLTNAERKKKEAAAGRPRPRAPTCGSGKAGGCCRNICSTLVVSQKNKVTCLVYKLCQVVSRTPVAAEAVLPQPLEAQMPMCGTQDVRQPLAEGLRLHRWNPRVTPQVDLIQRSFCARRWMRGCRYVGRL